MLNECYRKYGKRAFDLCAGIFGLVLVSPLFVIIAGLVKASDGGPIFYRQKRIGRYFRPFVLLKFRSMTVDAERSGPQITVRNDHRITSIGKLLRKTKLDELPQLINVVRGDMSLVGPRPEVPKYVDLFRADYERILTVMPGITDFAAVEFKDEERVLQQFDQPEEGYIKFILPRKMELYAKYISELGFWTDIKLIFLTILKIIR